MLKVEKPSDLLQHVGETLGPSEWITVTQEMIDKFADATGDHQWIHVDVERAKKEMPGGKTIAHGYLTLSLLPRLAPTLMKVEKRRRGLNYGSNRVRFTAPVPAGGAHPAQSEAPEGGAGGGQRLPRHQRDDHGGRGQLAPGHGRGDARHRLRLTLPNPLPSGERAG